MKLVYDQDLIEEAVFLAAARNRIEPALLRRFHREREKLYAILDPDERNDAFFNFNLEWFREWDLENLLLQAISEFPILKSSLSLLAFRKARLKKEEGAELYRAAGDSKGVVTLLSSHFVHPAGLALFLRKELFHLHDMLDPAFGYQPTLQEQHLTELQERIASERYKLLWDISIGNRLAKSASVTSKVEHQFHLAFSFWPEEKRAAILAELAQPQPTHSRFVQLCCDPKDLATSSVPAPGAHCPLCGFSTFQWATDLELSDFAPVITAEFPHWTPSQGACQRCAETYQYAVR